MASVRKKGQTIHSKARDVIRRVIQKCDEESNTGTLQHRLKQSNSRVANYTGISVRSVTSIRKEGVEAGNEALSTPGKKRPYSEGKKFHIDEFDQRVIRDTINDFYIVQKKVATVILTKLEEVTTHAMNSVTKIDWEGFTNHTLKLEQDFWIKDGLIEDVIDHFVIELGGVDSSESDDDQSSSESDLACPLD
ncbi:hypothetical protein J6590_007724 [Homalodisca vitripennis]|nr:hypothetical protein J6590_007724 [Homalodisca vitripennis]